MTFAIKRELLDAPLHDSAWSKRSEKAETPHEIEQVFIRFAKAEGFKVVEVST